ncbi:hypothetical protein ONZ43_g102 [Nemania bipapillata]|uniref:Uncharacterized protein n=1 Tax=Nemania bipapillata TaxID=110536 RepID=A0ACC2J9M0_9PEZI|nr:hypothetical protein ONZ43_g102 [Nemania bipapillata]
MRLLNVKKMVVEWADEEVTFQELKSGLENFQHKKGYAKIQKLYYRDSQVCYTYLADVSADDNPFNEGSEFRRSTWFTRGWTLQELVAPLYVTFFDRDWNEIGTKSSLQSIITELTGIPARVLLMNHAGTITVAERQAWVGSRETSVPEDEAYCLMGLLGVRIPVKYGEEEGEEATRKLHAEIERRKGSSSGDPSNFDVSSWMKPEREYRFVLPIQQPPSEAIRIEYPEVKGPVWTINDHEMGLWFGGSGNCATAIFKNKDDLRFAICLGVHNYNVWCGLTTDCEGGDLKAVSAAYWHGDKQGDRWGNMDRRGVYLPNGEVARLAIKKGRRNGKRVFFAEVHAEGFWVEKVGPGVFPDWLDG